MSLHPGTTLGTYEILAPLGAGGMGEVYRARDRDLDREVAIKVLSDSLSPTRFRVQGGEVDFEATADPERLARLEAEAKVLASLNHPNIATLFGLGREAERVYLAMELVEGETLADRIRRRPLALDEAVPIFLQIVDGLEAAHDKGISHRDLKPANLMITPSDDVKILDFGLARVLQTGEEASDEETSSGEDLTLTYESEQRSRLRGTLGYLSPEQARGRGIDKRADVWAFGCCLYEALTGRRPFEGETVSDTLSEILKGEPRWDRLPTTTPPAILRLLRRCLTKQRNLRLRDIGDARFELEEARVEVVEQAPRRRRAALGRRISLLGGALAVLLLGVLVGLALRPRSSPIEPASAVRRLSVPIPEDLEIAFDELAPLALSPEGSDLVFVGRTPNGTRLYRRQLGRLEVEELPGTEGARNPFFSPDGKWIGYLDGDRVRRTRLDGGQPVTVCEGFSPVVAAWGPDDTIVYSSWRRGLFRVPAVGGEAEQLTRPTLASGSGDRPGLTEHLLPTFLPGGRTMLFTSYTPPATANVELLSLDSGERRTLLAGAASARYLESGHLVYASEGDLWAAPFDLERLELSGAPVRVLTGVLHTLGTYPQYALSRRGDLLYVPGTVMAGQRRLAWVDLAGEVTALTADPKDYAFPDVSPDGRRVAVSAFGAGMDIWIYQLDLGTSTRFTFDEGIDVSPVWVQGGERLAYGCTESAPVAHLCWKAADGTGSVENLTRSDNTQLPSSVSPDGKVLLYNELAPETGWDIWSLDLDSGEQRVLVRSAHEENGAALSPDGRWLAYQSDASDRLEVYVRPFPDTESGLWQISTEGGRGAVWDPGGRYLYFLGEQSAMMRVQIHAEGGFRASRPEQLFAVAPTHDVRRVFDVAPDGRRFLMVREAEGEPGDAGRHRMVWVDDWSRELETLVPGV